MAENANAVAPVGIQWAHNSEDGTTLLSSVTLHLLGTPRIERNGTPIAVDTRKAIALVAYLAITKERQTRESLAAFLWPESDSAHARAALRRTLSALNKALDGLGVDSDRHTVGLVPDVATDIEAFRGHLSEIGAHPHATSEVCPGCVPPLKKAASIYRDDFLSGFSLRDSPAFDDWAFFEAETLRKELASTLDRLSTALCGIGRFDDAVGYARRWTAMDNLHEPAHRSLMRIYAWSGRRDAALRQYHECVRVLDHELGVPPLEETTRVYEDIKANSVPAPHVDQRLLRDEVKASPARVRAGDPHLYPLVGRSRELKTISEASDAGADGHLIVLEGEAGIGKTRLAEAFLEQAEGESRTTQVARCYEGETDLAYAPIVDCLRVALSDSMNSPRLADVPEPWLSEVSRFVPELARIRADLDTPPPVNDPGAQVRLLEGLTEVLGGLCGERGILLVDDVHWADPSTTELLSHLVRRLPQRSLTVLVCWRPEQVPPGHRLPGLLAEAQRSGHGTLVSLRRLNDADVKGLVDAARSSGARVGSRAERAVVEESEGVPFYAVEYLRAIADQSDPKGTGDSTDRMATGRLLYPRLAALEETARQLLTAAAVVGRSFSFDNLRVASGRSDEETVAGLEELMRQGLVREVPGGSTSTADEYDFSHEKVRSLVYDETTLGRRRLLHRRIADWLSGGAESRSEPGPKAATIARHLQLAGDDKRAASYFRFAGDYARSVYSNSEALAHYRSALDLGHPDPQALHESVGDLQTLSGDYAAALASYEGAASVPASGSSPRLEHKLGGVYQRKGEWALATAHFRTASQGLEETGPTPHRARVLADLSLAFYQGGNTVEATEFARRALDAAKAAADALGLAQSHNILGILARSTGNLAEAVSHLEQSKAIAVSEELRGAKIAALNNLALAYDSTGDGGKAAGLMEDALNLCVQYGDRHREAALHNNLSDVLHKTGEPESAMQHLKQAVAIFAEIGEDEGEMQPEIWKLVEW